ncbi:tetratricopeptide repeat protein [Salibacter halophilus]|uniref:dolichyl-phosphate-mannose--protein mannosyltransferase n=1 Tax=Salibacter halophilus TaxID=1803916 RepID=A0A6N6MB89_9FLAO|nr:tetratricopeptide repeat protein [Salibacter halophilus]KAB1065691.1 tetratricopeptide repeat protein [Salibacter halophilus]
MKPSQSTDLLFFLKPHLIWIIPVFAGLLYVNTLNHQFALDDYSVIVNHSYVQDGIDGIGDILTTNYRHGQGGFNDGLYRPLSLVSFALEKAFFGMNPKVSHFLNLLFYALGGLFLFRALRFIFRSYPLIIPVGIALIFLAHPLHTEVVANVKGRDELFAFFGFALCQFSFSKQIEKRSINYLVLGIVAFLFALFSKESAVTYSFIIPLLMFLHPKVSLKKTLPFLMILLPLSLIFMFWRNHIIDSMPNPVDEGNFNLLNNPIAATADSSLRWGSTFHLQLIYLKKLIFPFELIHDYSYNQIPLVKMTSWQGILGLLVLLSLVAASVWGLIKKNILGICAAIYLSSILVASQIAMPIGVQFAERLLFLAVLPFSIAVVMVLHRLITKSKNQFSVKDQKKLAVVSLVVCVVFSFKTIGRNQDWKNNLTLYGADVEKASQSARANYNYGTELQGQAFLLSDEQQMQQTLRESEKYLKKAIEIYPDYIDAYNNLGMTLKGLRNYSEAADVYRECIQLDPGYSKGYYNLGAVYFDSEQYEKCMIVLKEYVKFKPNNSQAYFIMAQAAEAQQDFEKAILFAKQSLDVNPNQLDVLNALGILYGKSGQSQLAANTFTQALQINPQRIDIWMNLAFAYHKMGDTQKEIETLEKVLQIQPQNQNAISRLQQLKR